MNEQLTTLNQNAIDCAFAAYERKLFGIFDTFYWNVISIELSYMLHEQTILSFSRSNVSNKSVQYVCRVNRKATDAKGKLFTLVSISPRFSIHFFSYYLFNSNAFFFFCFFLIQFGSFLSYLVVSHYPSFGVFIRLSRRFVYQNFRCF